MTATITLTYEEAMLFAIMLKDELRRRRAKALRTQGTTDFRFAEDTKAMLDSLNERIGKLVVV